MPDIGNYTETTELVLGEAGKYFTVLLFSVLAIRLWRRVSGNFGANRTKDLLSAALATLMACGIGYFSVCQSLGKLYSHYAMNAFRQNRPLQALALFEISSKYRKSADTLGQEGVCLLFLGAPDQGRFAIEKAGTLRKGKNTSFEQYYEGVYYFTQGQKSNSVPLLNAASADPVYLWDVSKLLAIMLLDENRVADAMHWMKPYMQAEVTDSDQAYIMASLKLAEGKKPEAQAIMDKFPTQEEDGSLAGKARFEKLRAQINR
jgi:Flp pilus assembly protein TadD